MSKIIKVNISGCHQQGLTQAIFSALAAWEITLIDIYQTADRESLDITLLLQLPDDNPDSPQLDSLLVLCTEQQLECSYHPVIFDRLPPSPRQAHNHSSKVLLLANTLTVEHLGRVVGAIFDSGLDLREIKCISESLDSEGKASCSAVCLTMVANNQWPENPLRDSLSVISTELQIDIVYLKGEEAESDYKLAVFDMDSTLIKAEVIDLLADAAGVGKQVAKITERAMQGELDFDSSFRERLAMLKGLDESVLNDIAERLPLMEGAETLMAGLKQRGYKTAIVSGGFNFFANCLKKQLGIDYVHANALEIINGKVSGQVAGPIINGQRKAELLHEIAASEGFSVTQVIAVGDGANDIPMLNSAGMGIAFHAKPLVRQQTQHAISLLGLDSILYLLD